MSATPGIAKPSFARFTLRIVKLGISIAYFALRFAWGWVITLGRATGGTGVVLYYHSVPREYSGRFDEQMKIVADHARPISLDTIERLPNGTHSIAITFDDALTSFVAHAVPVLELRKVPATVFAVVDALGKTPAWGEHYYSPEESVMSEQQLRTLPALISVGSHTLTHPHLPSVSEEAARLEICESRRKLESQLQKPVRTFSFPHGEFNDSIIAQCRKAGYERTFSTSPELLRDGSAKFVVGRVAADPWDWTLEFKLKMYGAYSWQFYLQSLKQNVKRVFVRKNEADLDPRHHAEHPLDVQQTHTPKNT